MDFDRTGTLSILHIPKFIYNKDSDTIVRVFSGTSLGTKLEVDISTDSLLDTVTTVEVVKTDSPNSFFPL